MVIGGVLGGTDQTLLEEFLRGLIWFALGYSAKYAARFVVDFWRSR